MRVSISDDADEDIREIFLFIALDNPIRADSFTDEIYDKIFDLAHSAFHFPLYETDLNVRRRPFKGYFIFYKIEQDYVTILRVLNSKRDYSNLFKG